MVLETYKWNSPKRKKHTPKLMHAVNTNYTVITYCFPYSDFSVMKSNEEMLLDLAHKLKGLRKIKGLTQEQVFHDTGIHIARTEQGKRDSSYTTPLN